MVTRKKQSHYIMIKSQLLKEKQKTILDIYAPNIKILKCIKQILTYLKGKTYKSTIRVRGCNTQVTAMVRLSRQKYNKKILDLSYTLGQTK